MDTRENTLSERERRVINALLDDPDAKTRRRARALLDWAGGAPPETIASNAGVRPSQIEKLTLGFAQARLELFPPAALERASRGLAGVTTAYELLDHYPTDVAHANYVTDLALQLYDATLQVHCLAPEWRAVLEAGARLHNLGAASGDDSPNPRAAHDLILAHQLAGYSATQRDVIACLALFHRKKVKPDRDPIFSVLDPATQRITLALAAILRVANALDNSLSQTTAITDIAVKSTVQVTVTGPFAPGDASRAAAKADLWNEVLPQPLTALAEGEPLAPDRPKKRKGKLGIQRKEPITRAARKLLSLQLARIQGLEDSVRAQQAVDSVHDMRVATRRMVSALRLTRPYIARKKYKKLRGELVELRDALGELRNLDVMLAHLRNYYKDLAPDQLLSLDPLIAAWEGDRLAAHQAVLKQLDSPGYDKWIEQVQEFFKSGSEDSAPRVADRVPEIVWKQYGVLRNFETRLGDASPEALHRLRIDVKQLRYTLEFFTEVLGPETPGLIEPLVALQDHLGTLQDTVIASRAVSEFIAAQARHARRHGGEAGSPEGAGLYLNLLLTRLLELRAGLPELWAPVMRPSYRAALAAAVAAL